MKYSEKTVTVPAGSLGSASAFCPSKWKATGGGTYYGDGLAAIAASGFGPSNDSYFVLIDNHDSPGVAQITAQVACIKSTSKAKARIASRAQAKAALEISVAALTAAHTAAG